KAAGASDDVIAQIAALKDNPQASLEMIGYDLSGLSSSFTPNVNVAREKRLSGLPMQTLMKLITNQLTTLLPNIKIVDSGTYTLRDGQTAGFLEYSMTVEVKPGLKVAIHGNQYYLAASSGTLALTLSAPEKDYKAKFKDTFAAIGKSFVLLAP